MKKLKLFILFGLVANIVMLAFNCKHYLGVKAEDIQSQLNEINSHMALVYNFSYDEKSNFNLVDIRVKFGVDKKLFDIVGPTAYGFEAKNSVSRHELFHGDLEQDDIDESIFYRRFIIDFDETYSSLKDVYTLRAFVTYRKTRYYSTSNISYSIVDMVKNYNEMQDSGVQQSIAPLYEYFQKIGLIK